MSALRGQRRRIETRVGSRSAVIAAVLVALVAVGAAGGTHPAKRDKSSPSSPTGIRITSSSGTAVLAWEPSADNVGVAGYDVSLGSRRMRVKVSALQVQGLRCGEILAARFAAFDSAHNRSRVTKATIHVPGCSTSRPGWSGGFETGDLSEWDFVHATVPDRFRVVPGERGTTPRLGSYMARVEVRANEPASWSASSNVALVEKSPAPDGSGALGADSYVGFSLFLPNGFPYVPKQLHNAIAEWHGDSNDVQASVQLTIDSIIGKHYGILNARPGFVLALHTRAGYNPVMFRFGDLVTGRWVDFVFRTKWATNSTGIIEGWMDGVKRFSGLRQTWYSGGQISMVKPQLGYYRANHSENAVLYVDAYKIGKSYASVAP